MSLVDILQHYMQPAIAPEHAVEHFEQVASQAPAAVVGDGIAEALRSEQTPPLPVMVAQLFERSSPVQRAGLLNELLHMLGPGVLTAIAGGALTQVLGNLQAQGGTPTITPAQAAQVTPEQASEVAEHAQACDPGIARRIGAFYAQHPDVVKALGEAALAIALGRIANRRAH
jgi:hypothetical protein